VLACCPDPGETGALALAPLARLATPMAQMQKADVSSSVTQDVLLWAGAEDHYVPLHQLYDQARWLTNARSVTTRLFTRAEHAQSHCQIGNLGLAVHTIGRWIENLTAVLSIRRSGRRQALIPRATHWSSPGLVLP
jgi:hypothetical protein